MNIDVILLLIVGKWKDIVEASLLNRVPCAPMCQRGLRANMPNCQILIFTCQHANKRANVP